MGHFVRNFVLEKRVLIKYQILFVFCFGSASEPSLELRYNAWHCASNLPCFETRVLKQQPT